MNFKSSPIRQRNRPQSRSAVNVKYLRRPERSTAGSDTAAPAGYQSANPRSRDEMEQRKRSGAMLNHYEPTALHVATGGGTPPRYGLPWLASEQPAA
jgi:hypothetical protein